MAAAISYHIDIMYIRECVIMYGGHIMYMYGHIIPYYDKCSTYDMI